MSLLVAAVLAGTVAAPAPGSRDALIARWLAAQNATVAKIHDPHKRVLAQRDLAAQAARLERPERAGGGPPAQLNALVSHELAIPGRYRLKPGPAPVVPPKPWWQRAMEWLGDRWKDLWRTAFGRVHPSDTQLSIALYLVSALALGLLAFVVIRMLSTIQLERLKKRSQIQALDKRADAGALYAAACARASAGDFAAASRLLFAATVAALDLRGDVVDRRSFTVGDLRGTLRSRDANLVGTFDTVAAPFVISTYAERPVTSMEWERARGAFASIAPEKRA